MDADNTCPTCREKYSNPDRKQMIICLNQHFICSQCVQKIAKRDSKCPFCKTKFKINEAQPRRIINQHLAKQKPQKILNLNLCPLQHHNGRFSLNSNICNKCGNYSTAHWNCYVCKYVHCATCLKVQHEQVCNQGNWIYDQSNLGCNICGKHETCGRTCQTCSMRICRLHDWKPQPQTPVRQYNCGSLCCIIFVLFILSSFTPLLSYLKRLI